MAAEALTTMDEMDEEETLIEQLQNLEDYTNATQLEILMKEADFMIENNIDGSHEWYDHRIDKIYDYNKLNWEEMYERFQNKDAYMQHSCAQIVQMTDYLIHQWSTDAVFDLKIYKSTLYGIHSVWKYYQSCFLGNETDGDVIDLIESMMHL